MDDDDRVRLWDADVGTWYLYEKLMAACDALAEDRVKTRALITQNAILSTENPTLKQRRLDHV